MRHGGFDWHCQSAHQQNGFVRHPGNPMQQVDASGGVFPLPLRPTSDVIRPLWTWRSLHLEVPGLRFDPCGNFFSAGMPQGRSLNSFLSIGLYGVSVVHDQQKCFDRPGFSGQQREKGLLLCMGSRRIGGCSQPDFDSIQNLSAFTGCIWAARSAGNTLAITAMPIAPSMTHVRVKGSIMVGISLK